MHSPTAASRSPSLRSVTLCVGLAQGGITHYGYALAQALARSGIETRVLHYSHPEYELVGYPHAHTESATLRLGMSYASRLIGPLQNLFVIARAARSAPIVHFQWSLGARNDRVILPLLRRLGHRIVYTAHDVLPHEPKIMSLEHCRWLYHYVDALIVHGEHLKQLLVERFDIDPERVNVIPHGNYNFIADTPSEWDRHAARASFGWNEDDRVILFFGLIRAYKGLDVLLEACRLIGARGLAKPQRLRLLIAGRSFDGHWEEGRYAALIREKGLEHASVTHLQHIPLQEVPRFFRSADVVAVPYKRGSQSGVLQLAYSFGKAAVATRVGSLGEAALGRLAHAVAPEDPAALADALYDILVDPALAHQLGASARRFTDTELDWGPIAERTKTLYQSLI